MIVDLVENLTFFLVRMDYNFSTLLWQAQYTTACVCFSIITHYQL